MKPLFRAHRVFLGIALGLATLSPTTNADPTGLEAYLRDTKWRSELEGADFQEFEQRFESSNTLTKDDLRLNTAWVGRCIDEGYPHLQKPALLRIKKKFLVLTAAPGSDWFDSWTFERADFVTSSLLRSQPRTQFKAERSEATYRAEDGIEVSLRKQDESHYTVRYRKVDDRAANEQMICVFPKRI